MTNPHDGALGMVGTAMTLMFGVAMIKYAQDSTKDLMKSNGRGKGRNFTTKFAPDFSPPKGTKPRFDPFGVKF